MWGCKEKVVKVHVRQDSQDLAFHLQGGWRKEVMQFLSHLVEKVQMKDELITLSLKPTSASLLPLWLSCKESVYNAGDLGSISGLGRSPGEGKGYPLQYSCLEFHGLYSSWGHKESDMTERFSLSLSVPPYLGLLWFIFSTYVSKVYFSYNDWHREDTQWYFSVNEMRLVIWDLDVHIYIYIFRDVLYICLYIWEFL